MSLETIQAAIATRFFAAHPTGWNQTAWPVVAENQPWGASKQPTDKAWARLSVRMSDNFNTTVDGKARRVPGMVWVQVFVPENKGSLEAKKMGDELERIFANKTITSGAEVIRFERASTSYVGNENGWEQHRCIVDFIADAVTP